MLCSYELFQNRCKLSVQYYLNLFECLSVVLYCIHMFNTVIFHSLNLSFTYIVNITSLQLTTWLGFLLRLFTNEHFYYSMEFFPFARLVFFCSFIRFEPLFTITTMWAHRKKFPLNMKKCYGIFCHTNLKNMIEFWRTCERYKKAKNCKNEISSRECFHGKNQLKNYANFNIRCNNNFSEYIDLIMV